MKTRKSLSPAAGPPMARRDFIRALVAGSAGALDPTRANGWALGDRPATARPNILYIHSHDTGRYISPYGHDVPTPNLQRLAEEGILFRQAFSAAPTCSPSRASLLTGQCPHSNGMLGLAHRGFSLSDYRQHILHTLRKAGYRSVLIGLQHIARDPRVIGHDLLRQIRGNHVEQVAPAAVEYLKSSPPQPFFLTVGFFETHRPYREPVEKQDDWRYTAPPAPIPDAPETRRDMAAFKASARKLDWAMGEIFRALEETHLAENTLVIATTDHGIAFPAMKCNLTDHGMGIALVMRGPGGFAGGRVLDAMISQTDLFPTLTELVEIEKPGWLQGKSILPLVRGQAQEIQDEVFAEVNYHASYEPMRAVRTKRWKYIRRFDGRHRPVLPNCDDGPSKTLWLDHNWRGQPVVEEELYDLIFDPNERRNLTADSQVGSVLVEMRGRLERWMRATNDPLLRGPVKAPPGAVANDPDGISPNETPREVTY